MFAANADRLDVLPAHLATRLVRFHAMREGAAHLISQSHHVRCDVVRATLQSLAHGADEVLGAS